MTLSLFSTLVISFFLGSLPFGWLIAKVWGVRDLRTEGSKNIGATNVVRTAGWLPGALTFLLDFAKGAVPVYFLACQGALVCSEPNVLPGFAAILGHCFSPFLYFRGGKGVSTLLGMVLVLQPLLGGVAIAAYLLALAVLRVSAIGSLFAMATVLLGELLFATALLERFFVVLAVLLVLQRHHKNWDQLLKNALSVAVASLTSLLILSSTQPAMAADQTLSVPAKKLVQDFRGKSLEFTQEPSRVVALMPALAEALFDLGKGKSILAVPEYTTVPPAFAKQVKNVGPYPRLSAEIIHSLKPDLVLASMDGNESSVIQKLEELGDKVLVVNTTSIEEILRTLKLLANVFNEQNNSKLKAFENNFEKVAPPIGIKKVFLQVGWDPLITVGGKTYLDGLITAAGGINVFSDAGLKYPRPSAEAVVMANPDIIVICQLTESGADELRARDFWKRFPKLKAAAENKIFILKGDILTKPGFSLTLGLAELKKIVKGTAK